jgi:DNA-binding CsgD family transcriptional regulator
MPDGLYGTTKLTPKETEIVKLVTAGLKNDEIATAMGTTEHVIKNYLRTIYDKTGMFNRLELALWYVKNSEE